MGCSCSIGLNTKEEKFLEKPQDVSTVLSKMDNPKLSQVKSTIETIYLLRARMLYQFNKLIYETGACCFKNPSIVQCFKSILYKLSSIKEGFIEQYELNYNEEPPYLVDNEEKKDEKLQLLFNFIIEIRSYKSIVRQLERDVPGLLYIIYENKEIITPNEERLIKDAIEIFDEFKSYRVKILQEYKGEIYYYVTQNEKYVEEINKVGTKAFQNKITDIYEIVMLLKDCIDKKETEENISDLSDNISKQDLYEKIEEGKEKIAQIISQEKEELEKYKKLKVASSLNSSSTNFLNN